MAQFLNLKERMYEGVGQYGIPQIIGVNTINVCEWIGFNNVMSYKQKPEKIGVNFFLDDYQFERVWNDPGRYVEYVKKFGVVLSPDFSLYTDFPKSIQIFNHYRKHWCAAYWQENGVNVIPTVAWSDKESYEWCFDGEPEGSILAVSNIGCMMDKDTRKAFKDGYNEMVTRLQPSKILLFTYTHEDYRGNVEYIINQRFKKVDRR